MNAVAKPNILIVDDNSNNLFTVTSILANQEYNLVEAHSGNQALKALLEFDFAVILLDVMMPGIDGFQTARLIRARSKTAKTPIIFVTSLGTEESSIFEAYAVGAVDYIPTPIKPQILRAKVAAFVDLFQKTEELKRQSQLLQQIERQKHEREMNEQKQGFEIEKLKVREEHLMREREAEYRNATLLSEKAKELERSNLELERFAFAASHDMQEPLRTIISYSQLLEEVASKKMDKDDIEIVQFISGAAKRMQHLIRSLLDYSLVGRAGKLEFKNVDCNRMINQILRNLDASIKETGTRFVVGELPVLKGEESQIIQLFQNLISNAMKFRGESPEIKITSKLEEDHWEFCVEDNGIGIELEYQEQIFTLFKRLHSQEKYPGSGLGLSLCKKIVHNHGGRIWVESEFGSGTKFRFTLPVSPPSAPEEPMQPPQKNSQFSRQTQAELSGQL